MTLPNRTTDRSQAADRLPDSARYAGENDLRVSDFEITTPDGEILAARLFAPAAPPRIATVLHPATAVPRGFYGRFAQWLAREHGHAVLTYDYRQFGHSWSGHPRDAAATMIDWGLQDQNAALNELVARYPALPVWVIGHSLGGHFTMFHDAAPQISRLIAVSSGIAGMSAHPWWFKPPVWLYWWLFGPVASKLFGYVPGFLLGGEDLPSGVFWDWRRWCLGPSFHKIDWGNRLPVPDLQRFRATLRTVAASDDIMIMPHAVSAMGALFYPSARHEHVLVTPREIGTKSIGHIGLFASRNRAAWPVIIAD